MGKNELKVFSYTITLNQPLDKLGKKPGDYVECHKPKKHSLFIRLLSKIRRLFYER